jgi:hypothetical protein
MHVFLIFVCNDFILATEIPGVGELMYASFAADPTSTVQGEWLLF